MNIVNISNKLKEFLKSKDSRLQRPEKMVMILILLDIIEIYSMDALPGTKQELKQAVKKAIQVNRSMTKVAAKYLGFAQEISEEDIAEHFCTAAEFIQDLIETYYHNELIEEDGYVKIKIDE